MRILITGATGIIGQSLIRNISTNHPNAIIDATYFSKPFKSCLVESDNKKINLNYIPYYSAFKNTKKYNQIWHFATYGQPSKFINDWKPVVKLNTEDIISLSSSLKEGGKFFYASTSELYGQSENSSEDMVPSTFTCKPRSIYIDSKRLGESIVYSLFPCHDFRIFRICLAYSPYFKKGDKRVLYDLVTKGLYEKQINLLDDGSALRQYLYIDDACEMMTKIAFTDYKNLHLNNEAPIFNISNNNPVTILELANIIGYNLNVKVFKGEKKNNLYSALPIVSVLPKRFMNLFPDYQFTNLNEGVSIVCNYAKKAYMKKY